MDSIFERSDEFSVTGITRFKRWELRSWFGVERIGKNVWRSIKDNLDEKRPGSDIVVIEVNDYFIVFDQNIAERIVSKI